MAAWDTTAPTIGSATALAAGNAYLDITFSDGVYGANDGVTALTASKLALTFTQNGGGASNVTISSVKQANGAAEGSCFALAGGATIVRVFLTITGTPSGVETIEIKPASGTSLYDRAGNACAADQTTGVKTLRDRAAPAVRSILRQTPFAAWTAGTEVVYRVTFTESVTGVDKDDFSLTTVQGDASGTIASVSAVSGTAYDVTVNTLSGAGRLRPDLKGSDTGIADATANAIAAVSRGADLPALARRRPSRGTRHREAARPTRRHELVPVAVRGTARWPARRRRRRGRQHAHVAISTDGLAFSLGTAAPLSSGNAMGSARAGRRRRLGVLSGEEPVAAAVGTMHTLVLARRHGSLVGLEPAGRARWAAASRVPLQGSRPVGV